MSVCMCVNVCAYGCLCRCVCAEVYMCAGKRENEVKIEKESTLENESEKC